MKKRLFLAIRCDQGIQEEALPALKKLKIKADQMGFEARWTAPTNFHVTLVFLGAVEPAKLETIMERVGLVATRHAPFQLKITGMGAFPDDLKARTLWLGVQNSKALRGLQNDLQSEVFNTDSREFAPYLTVAKFRNPHKSKDLLSPFVRKSFGKAQITELVLYESLVKPPYSFHKQISIFNLTGPETEPADLFEV